MKNIRLIIFVVLNMLVSCDKFIETVPPKTDLISATVFKSDETAQAAMASIYAQMISGGLASGTNFSFTYYACLSADEVDNYSSAILRQQFSNNQILANNTELATNIWNSGYQSIYRANAIIEGLHLSTGLTSSLSKQLEGEAKFIRAFFHFYLLNIFGDIPLVLTTDYRINSVIPRSPGNKVYTQIIADLSDAKEKLPQDYIFANNERVRPNKFAALALLSRVYLYMEDWARSEELAGTIIGQANLYDTVPLSSVFLKNSKEAIFQLMKDNSNTNEASTFIINGTRPLNAALKTSFLNAFDPLDKRRNEWISVKTSGANSWYFPYKYRQLGISPVTEYSTVLRLGEQYLIRAEARAHQEKISGTESAESDLNIIRKRAGLEPLHLIDKQAALDAIENERKFELFTEWGHRWLDLKRTDRANAVLGPVKGNNWQSTDQLYPIPQNEINNNPSLINKQNPGYE